MARIKSLLTVSIVVFAAIGFAAFFPQECQHAFFNTVFTIFKWKHQYWLKDDTQVSAGALAFADLFRNSPLSYDVPLLRKMLDGLSALYPLSSTTTITEVTLRSNLTGYWITPAGVDETNGPVILYLHGGAFISGSMSSHAGFVAELARRVNGRGFFLDYKLAPDSVLPAQTDECVLAYRWLVDSQKISPKRIALVGDSAGGGLVFLTLLALNQEEHGRFVPPAAAVTISAWTDLATSPEGRPSYQKNKENDVVLSKEWLLVNAARATGTQENEYEKRKSPKFSPIYASLEGQKFPPLLMQVGGHEILKDDTVHFVGKAKQVPMDVTLEEYPFMQHNIPLGWNFFPEGEKALSDIVTFIKSHVKV